MTMGRWVGGACLVLGFIASSAIGALAAVFNPTTFTLDNGMEVIVVENHRAPVVSHWVWYRAGSADEPPGKSGIAHYLEHLMFRGTETIAPGEYSQIVSRNGGNHNAFTSYDYTAYFQMVASDRLELVMRLEADRMVNLKIRDEEAAPELGVVMAEREQRVDSEPGAMLGERLAAALYAHHPYRMPIIGWEHELLALTRADAESFYETWYAPNNAVLIVVGDTTPEEVRTLAERHYGPIPRKEVPERRRLAIPDLVGDVRVTYADPRVSQPSFRRQWLAPSDGNAAPGESEALQVLAELMSGATGRLYQSLVVDQRVATGAGLWYSNDLMDYGSIGIWGVPTQESDITTVENALSVELERLLADGVTEDEVSRAKIRLQDAAVFALDSIYRPARALGTAWATGRSVERVESWPDRIAAVTVDDVVAAARAYLDGYSVVGLLVPEGYQQHAAVKVDKSVAEEAVQ